MRPRTARRSLSARQRQVIITRAGGCCEYCRSPDRYAPDPFLVDHVQPRARGGSHDLSNLAYACAGCNGRKYAATMARDPATGAEVPLYNPRQQRWEEQFAWSNDFTHIVGRTPTGRATVERLDLNRPHLVRLRRRLYALGDHPPPGLAPGE